MTGLIGSIGMHKLHLLVLDFAVPGCLAPPEGMGRLVKESVRMDKSLD